MRTLLPLLLATALFAGGCAPRAWDYEEEGSFDPLEDMNRASYTLHKGLDGIFFRPVAGAYRGLVPATMRTGVRNFFHNLEEPGNIVNNTLQKKGKGALNSTARFVFNTVFGMGGLFDVSSRMDLPRSPATFGQTLRGYGMKNTTYFFIPLLGPTTFGDSLGGAADTFTRPQNYRIPVTTVEKVNTAEGVQKRSDLLGVTNLVEAAALDEYLFIRDAYEDSRRNEAPPIVWGGR